jgi:hypothetical protein
VGATLMSAVKTVACPQCGARVDWSPASKFRPFCSERCKLIDLGAWAAEAYRIPLAQPTDSEEARESQKPVSTPAAAPRRK